jgi:prolyl oligopeptidase
MPMSTLLKLALGVLTVSPQAPGGTEGPGALLSIPFSRGNLVFTTRSEGEGKAAFCVQNGITGKPRVLLDSSQDPFLPKFPLDSYCVSADAKYFLYILPQVPHRFEELRVAEVKSGKPLPDRIEWTYYSDLAWRRDGFIYGRYPAPSDANAPDLATRPPSATDHLNEKIYFHRLATSPDADQLLFQDPEHPKQKYLFLQDFARRWFHVHIMVEPSFQSKSTEWFSPWKTGRLSLTAIQPNPSEARFYLCDDLANSFLIFTFYKSPKGRIIRVDPKHPTEADWQTVVPEGEETFEADPACGKLLLNYKPSSGGSRVEIRNMDGKLEKTLPTPPGDVADVQWCAPTEKQFFFSLQHGKDAKKYFCYRVDSGETLPVQ